MATASHPVRRRPEVLAPAGDADAMRAAIRAGADAVYFGLQGFNARARATNFDEASLADTMAMLHGHGVRGYVTLNTLLFETEFAALERAVRACAAAGVDAVIVQDLGVAQTVRAIAPTLPIHASTQMTCTDAASVLFAASLGARRVVLARELSLEDIATIARETDVELEVFVHGALCIAYSGQCLTSEAIGGRSANRGACAQSCRLPYELLVDGEEKDLGDRAYLLSPQDLEASAHVPSLASAGVSSLKIEGRLKGPEYVSATVRLYRAAIDSAMNDSDGVAGHVRETALQMYSRGSGSGFLAGVDHQRLVEGRTCDHRGTLVARCEGTRSIRGRVHARLKLEGALSRGDGVLIEGGFAGEGEVGGRVWSILREGNEVESALAGEEVLVWFGPERPLDTAPAARRVFKTDDPSLKRTVRTAIEREMHREAMTVTVRGHFGELPVFEARTVRGLAATVQGDCAIEPARDRPLTEEALTEKLGKLGDTPFELARVHSHLPTDAIVPLSSLNRARRALVEALEQSARRSHPVSDVSVGTLFSQALPPDRAPPPAGLFVLCRTLEQALAAVDAGVDGVYLDFLELTGTGDAVRALRNHPTRGHVHITVAPPRIRKPGEEKIDRYLHSLGADAFLVRGLGALYESADAVGALRIGDFSLNVTNRLSARTVLSHGCAAFTPSFDLDAAQLVELLATPFGPYAELVVHHPMPLFHMEHCVIAALLSDGADYKTCGRPCEKHQISLRDRAGMVHPVEADVGCRNTVFHGSAQSAAGIVPAAVSHGVRRFRIELVREKGEEIPRIVQAYRALLAGGRTPSDVFRTLKADGHYGVVRGSLRVI